MVVLFFNLTFLKCLHCTILRWHLFLFSAEDGFLAPYEALLFAVIPRVSPCVMLNVAWNARDRCSILRDWLQSVPSHRIGVALTLVAFQLASLVDIAGLKVSGGHGDEQSYSVLFQPKFQASLWGSESCFRFGGILKLCVGSCSVWCDELCRTKWGHTRFSPKYSICRQHSSLNGRECTAVWSKMDRNCSTVVLLWKGKRPVFLAGGMCLLPWKYSSGFWGDFTPYFITLEGLLCVCSFLVWLPPFLAACPIWSPDSLDFYGLSLLVRLLPIYPWLITFFMLLYTDDHLQVHTITDLRKMFWKEFPTF